MIIQCDSGHVNGDLIACARNRIYDLKAKADDGQITHVLFVIHLPHHMVSSSFVGFQGDPWVSSHVDDLRPTADNAVMPHDVIGSTTSELFIGTPESSFLLSSERRNAHKHAASNGLVASTPSTESMDVSDPSEEAAATEEMASDGEEKDSVRAAVHWEDDEMEVVPSQVVESDEMVVGDTQTEQLDASNSNNRTGAGPQSSTVSHPKTFSVGGETKDEVSENPAAIPSTSSPLYRRLHSCIYAAASKLKDFTTKRSTKRVEILIRLIPQEAINLSGKIS